MASTESLQVANLFSLKDYVCLITGGGTGIGLMAAQALSANGAKVYITGRRLEALENAAKQHSPSSTTGGSIIPIGPCDVTSKASLEELYTSLSKKEKYINFLMTAAGISGPKAAPDTSSATELKNKLWSAESESDWNSVYNTNVTSVYFSTVAFLPLLQAAPINAHSSPSVIVISSMSGLMRHAQGHFTYNAAKAATAHLSAMMSREFAQTGIRVNSIAPGYFPSEMTMGGSDERQKTELPKEKVLDKAHPVPAGRAGSDEEMGMAVVFLARCGYVNGEILKVDGGVMNEVGGT